MFSKEKCDVVGLKYIFQDFLQCVCVYLHICECVHLCICEHCHGA